MKRKVVGIMMLAVVLTAAFGLKSQAAFKPVCDFKEFYEILCNKWMECLPSRPETDKPMIPEIPEEETPELPEEEAPEVNVNAHAYELKVLELVNVERAKHSLSALSWSDELAKVARAHSQDMLSRNFFSHTNPDGKSPFDRIKASGISYRSAGENIAAGQRTPEEVVEAWMNSDGHRANILNSSYTKLGVGYVSGNGAYGTYWTQNFAG